MKENIHPKQIQEAFQHCEITFFEAQRRHACVALFSFEEGNCRE